MWNWMVSALTLGTTLVLYDGSPLHPHPTVMWDLVDKCGITVFGTSAKWIAVQEDRGLKPRISHNLGTLKVLSLANVLCTIQCTIFCIFSVLYLILITKILFPGNTKHWLTT